jgi:transposase
VDCIVAAPSLIPVRPGDRRKTDKRDASKLAHLLRAGELVAVSVPEPALERVRALTRCRETFSREVRSSRHHVVKFLALQGLAYREGRQWTQAHWRWLRAVKLEPPAQQALESYVALLDFKLSQLTRIDQQLEALAPKVDFADAIARARCLRGFDTVSAMTVAAEIGDVRRFGSPRQLMAFFGLAVSEHSSGGPDKHHRGPITKTGNARCRRLMVEAAWHYRHPPRTSRALQRRREGQSAAVVAHADRAQHRLYARYRRLSEKMLLTKVVVALARELTGFLWAVLRGEPQLLLARPR